MVCFQNRKRFLVFGLSHLINEIFDQEDATLQKALRERRRKRDGCAGIDTPDNGCENSRTSVLSDRRTSSKIWSSLFDVQAGKGANSCSLWMTSRIVSGALLPAVSPVLHRMCATSFTQELLLVFLNYCLYSGRFQLTTTGHSAEGTADCHDTKVVLCSCQTKRA